MFSGDWACTLNPWMTKQNPIHKHPWGLTVIYSLIFPQGTFYEISEAKQLKTVVSDIKHHGQHFSIMNNDYVVGEALKPEDLKTSMKLRHVSSII